MIVYQLFITIKQHPILVQKIEKYRSSYPLVPITETVIFRNAIKQVGSFLLLRWI